jgi:mono/diheme cytochrome c family protein
MLFALMTRPHLRTLLLAVVVAACAVAASGCGQTGITVARSNPLYKGAEIFNQRCSGCHTYDAAGTEGSATSIKSREYKDGPNFNQRKEQYQDVLYAIRNGGFSSGPMPQNIATGPAAQELAAFVSHYAGSKRKVPKSPGGSTVPDCPAG